MVRYYSENLGIKLLDGCNYCKNLKKYKIGLSNRDDFKLEFPLKVLT